jgi:hypothetical protein
MGFSLKNKSPKLVLTMPFCILRASQVLWLWLALVVILYWLPILSSAAGLTENLAWMQMPRRLTFQHAVAGLFSNRQTSWTQPVYHVRTEKTKGKWITLDRSLMSEIAVAGFKHRVDRVVSTARKSKSTGNAIFAALAEHAAAQVAAKRPDLGAVTGFRVVSLIFPTNTPEMAQPAGAWVIPKSNEMDPKQVRLTAEVAVKDGRALSVRRGGESTATPVRAGAPITQAAGERKQEEKDKSKGE